MSNFSIIQDVSLELRRHIVEVLEMTSDTNFNINGDVDKISLLSPGETLENSVIASLYLYHLDIDKHLRNQRPLPDPNADDLFHRPPIPLQLRYLFTPVDDSEATNQLLLGRVIQHFHDFPNLATIAGTPIGDSFGGASPELRVRPDMLSLEQLAQMWNAFSAPFRVSLSLLVEVVAIDSGRPPMQVRRIDQLVPAVGQMGRER